MRLMPFPARLSALLVGAIVAASCDTRLPTQSRGADDVERPVVTFTVSGGVNNAVAAGVPLTVTVTATDNKGISTILTTVRSGSQVIGLDTATLKPTATSTSRVVPVNLTGLPRGARITVRTTVTDAAFNTRTDSVVVTIASPTLTFITPVVGAKLNVGDSLLVTVRLQDAAGLTRLVLAAFSARGNPSLGTADTVQRYNTVTVPGTGNFRANLVDTVITRFIVARTPIDTLTDSLFVRAITTDVLGAVDTSRVTVKIVRGPSVIVLSPVAGDSATPGAGLTVTLRATDATGVARLGFRIQSDASFPTRIDTTIIQTYAGLPKDVTFTSTLGIPVNAPPRAQLTITPISTNAGGQDGASAPTIIAVRAGLPPAPRVFQTIAARVETQDSLSITAVGNGITAVGYILRDSVGTVVKRDSVVSVAPFPSTSVVTLPLSLPTTAQGKRFTVISFAYDQGGRIGFSLPAGATTFQSNLANAFVDSTLVVYGKTYPLPSNRNGVVADLQVDQARGNVFLSNINFGRLEVWQRGTSSFDANGIVVGSQPWGMTMSRTAPNRDTMYVANSGGTNLSRVFVGTTSASSMREDLDHRLLTRVSFLYKVSEARDENTQKIRLTVSGPFLFSDRPQYVEQSVSGRLYFSTRPTPAAPRGTIRYLDPSTDTPDQRFILAFATRGADLNSYLIANVDSVIVAPAPANSTVSDRLFICDHPTGTRTAPSVCANSILGIDTTIARLRAALPTTDLQFAVNADESSLGLTDTTYAAASGDGRFIAFGEGNRAPQGRAFMVKDDGIGPVSATPSIVIADLINNASDRVFGLALDRTGQTLGVHGSESYFALVDQPFTLRLQGKKSTFSTGAGITFHPNANGVTTPQASRLAFVASNNGSIEAVDIAFYDFSRGALATKFNLYGPLRASLPFPGDDGSVVLKLFGVSAKGLVVIDVTAADIKAGP